MKQRKGSNSQTAKKKSAKDLSPDDRDIAEGSHGLEYDPDLGIMASQDVAVVIQVWVSYIPGS